MPGGFDTVLVVDFGAQYAQLIARRVRECHVYSEIVPSTMPVEEMLAKRPKAIILSGGPASVYADGAPPAPPGLFDAGVPVLGICYGFQLMVAGLGGTVERTGAAEYGSAVLVRGDDPPQTPPAPGGKPFPPDPLGPPSGGRLLAGTPARQRVWMSHGDTCTAAPPGFTVTARTDVTPVAAVENERARMFGVQFHPEVMHTEHGTRILARFLELAGCRPSWTTLNIVEEQVALIREQVGDGRAICGLSGGVDSAVAAALVQRAIGDRLTCVFVDHGLLRKGEAEQVEQDFVAATGVRLKVANEAEAFLFRPGRGGRPRAEAEDHRPGVHPRVRARRPGDHRRGRPARRGVRVPGAGHAVPGRGGVGRRHRHREHQVAPQRRRAARRPEVPPGRAAARSVQGRGAAGRVRTRPAAADRPPPAVPRPRAGHQDHRRGDRRSRLAVLREADAIVREEMSAAGLDTLVWQCPVVLLADVRSVGVQGDGRSYGHPIVLRPVTSEDAMTADWARLPDDVLARISTRVTNEVPEVNRVVLDVTSKPPATIEWE